MDRRTFIKLTAISGTSATLAGQIDDMLRAGDVLTLASTEKPSVGMTFVANGRIRTSLDATRKVWVIEAKPHISVRPDSFSAAFPRRKNR